MREEIKKEESQEEIVECGEMQMGVNFQRKIHLVMPVETGTNPINF